MDIMDGIGAPGNIETFILNGLGTTDTGGGGTPGTGETVLALSGMSGSQSGGSDDIEVG